MGIDARSSRRQDMDAKKDDTIRVVQPNDGPAGLHQKLYACLVPAEIAGNEQGL
jgi:hypothetical protein